MARTGADTDNGKGLSPTAPSKLAARLSSPKQQVIAVLVALIVLAGVGYGVRFGLHAATNATALEAESGSSTLSISDTTASGASAIKFKAQPQSQTAVFGANFGSGPDESLYVKPVKVARLFPGSGYPNDITTMSAYKEAKAAGAKVIIIDFPADWTSANVTSVVQSAVADGMTVLASAVHEPEHNNKMSAPDWVATNIRIAPVIRAAGGKVAPILQTGTVLGLQGRTLSDYDLPPGTADYGGFDYYPGNFATAQAQVLPQLKAASQSVYGTSKWIIGEYGVTPDNTQGPALISAFQTYFSANGGVYASYWSQDTTVFDDATAAAWFN